MVQMHQGLQCLYLLCSDRCLESCCSCYVLWNFKTCISLGEAWMLAIARFKIFVYLKLFSLFIFAFALITFGF